MDQPLPGYDTSLGNKKAWVGDHFGPTSYVTGGETFDARHLGWGGFDLVSGTTYTFSRAYFVTVIWPVAGVGAVSHVDFVWYDAVTALEVAQGTDLSAEKVRVFAIGV